MILLLIIEFDLMHFTETWLCGWAVGFRGSSYADDEFFRSPPPDARGGRVDADLPLPSFWQG